MTFTTHGYHIEGTDYLGVTIPDSQMAPCGGPESCGACEAEAMRSLSNGENPIKAKAVNPYTTVIADKVEELKRLIVGGYVNSRERALAITNIEQGGHWLDHAAPADPVVAKNIDPAYLEFAASSDGQ